jgi:hypothetical protein
MGEPNPIDRVSTDDLMSLATEHGANPMQVGAVLLLDARSGLEPEQAAHLLARRIRSVPWLRQRLVTGTEAAPEVGPGRPPPPAAHHAQPADGHDPDACPDLPALRHVLAEQIDALAG